MRLAKQGVYFSWQGEGHLTGQPMVFVRMSGCSVGCIGCDTNYRLDSVRPALEVARECEKAFPQSVRDRWVWITGGEPTDQPEELAVLIRELKKRRLSVAVATSGKARVSAPVDWLSVSPHDYLPLGQPFGNELKLVDGLNGLDPFKWIATVGDHSFWLKFVQPFSDPNAPAIERASHARCLEFVQRHPDWCLSTQAHRYWGLP